LLSSHPLHSLSALFFIQTRYPVGAAIGLDRLYGAGILTPALPEKHAGAVYLAYREMVVIARSVPGKALLPVIHGNAQISVDTSNLPGADEGGVLPAAVAAA
jgi:hypothetical protein